LPGERLTDLLTQAAGWVAHWPWLAAVAPAVLAAAVLTRAWWLRRRQARLAGQPRYLSITPPAQVDPAGAAAWWANLYELLAPQRRRRILRGTPHVALEYRWAGRKLTIGVWLPAAVPAVPVAAAVRAAWPGAATSILDAPAVPLPPAALAEGGTLAAARPGWYPLTTDHTTDPVRPLVEAAAGLHRDEYACVQTLARPATPTRTGRLRRGAVALRTGRPPGGLLDPTTWIRGALNLLTARPAPRTLTASRASADPLRDRDARAAVEKVAGPQWEVAIRYGVANTNPRHVPPQNLQARLTTLAHAIASAHGTHTATNRLRRRPLRHPADVLSGRMFTRGFLLSAAELAAVAGLPTDLAVPGLDRARARAVPAPVAIPAGGRNTKTLGRAQVGGHAVAVPVVDTRAHLHVLGSTGSGKTTFLCHLILADIHAGRGVVVIDPKGDLAADLLDRLPRSVADRLVLIDPDQPGGATLNPLAGDDHDLVVDNIVSIFSKIFQRHWGPRIDDVLRVACLTLMRRTSATLTLVPPLLNDKQFRAAFTVDLDDPDGLRGFWEWYETTPPPLRAQIIGPVLARLRAFLLRDFVRRTLGTARSSFDMGAVLDGGVLIARLPKGQLGEETAKLMGSFVFASVWQAATARSRTGERARKDAAIYIDEAHNVLNLAGSVGDMLAEARGYHLSLTLAHQNLTQLPRDTQLAISANARNKLYFTCSPEDAHQLARHTLPELDEHDLSHLDAYTAAARLVVNNRETPAFTLTTRPPAPPTGHTTAIRAAIAQPQPASTAPAEQPTDPPDSAMGEDPGNPLRKPLRTNRPAPEPPADPTAQVGAHAS
jgi:energy-coupling factor transporter ATP-binding protein EcfA2